MGKERPPIIATLTTALLVLTGCGNDTGNENETPGVLIKSPAAGFDSASEITNPDSSSVSRATSTPALTKESETREDHELAAELGSLWGPVVLSPTPLAAEESPSESAKTETEDPSEDTITSTSDKDSATAHYKNGEHIATGTYNSPAGPEAIRVELVLQSDRISNVIVIPLATHAISLKMQRQFAEDIGLEVTGKPLDEIKNLTSVNGSSLAPEGFLNALAAIRKDAAI